MIQPWSAQGAEEAISYRQFDYPVLIADGPRSYVSATVVWTLGPGCYDRLFAYVSFSFGPGMPYYVHYAELPPNAGPHAWTWNGRGHFGYYQRLYYYGVVARTCGGALKSFTTPEFSFAQAVV